MIIFGWPKKTKEYGPAYPLYCDHCRNDTIYHYLKQRRWFSLFFIPVLPLSRSKHYLACDVCGASLELDENDERNLAKQATKITESYLADAMSEAEYFEDIDRLYDESELFTGTTSAPEDQLESGQAHETTSIADGPD